MFDTLTAQDAAPAAPAQVLNSADLAAMTSALQRLATDVADAELVEQIRRLEECKSALAAAQAQVTARFAASQHAAQRAAGVPAAETGRGIAAQVGLAKRESAARARRYLGWAKVLVAELPHTRSALRSGQTSEWRAMLVARETACLSVEHRARVDAEIGPLLGDWGDRQVQAEARRWACRLDPGAVADRARLAEADRRVTLRPAPDTMTVLSAVLPVKQGVAVYKALSQHAEGARASGDARGRGPVMADTLVERITGHRTAAQVPVEVNLIMTDHTLLADTTGGGTTAGGEIAGDAVADTAAEPAVVEGYGPIPAPLARRMVAEADETTAVWLRRLYTRPDHGALVAMESTRRRFEHGLRRFLIIRDQTCRTSWCDAPVRHLDHAVPVEHGGATSAENGQGYCEACNYAKQAPGWRAKPGPGGAGRTVVTTTPTGHTYTSRPPDPPGKAPPDLAALHRLLDTPSRLEDRLRDLVLAA